MRGLPIFAVLALTLLAIAPAFGDTIFYLNTDETPGSIPVNTIQVDVSLLTSTTATVKFTNTDPSDSSWDLHNAFLNVKGASAVGTSSLNTCTELNSCAFITGTGTGNGTYYYVLNQSGGFGAMTYNVDDTGTAATSITVDLVATGANSWANSSSVLTPNGSGYEASVDLVTQSGLQAAGTYSGLATPEPSCAALMAAGLLLLLPYARRHRLG